MTTQTAAAPLAAEPKPIRLKLANCARTQGVTTQGVDYVVFRSPAFPTVMGFGAIARMMLDDLSVNGHAIEHNGVLKVVAARCPVTRLVHDENGPVAA